MGVSKDKKRMAVSFVTVFAMAFTMIVASASSVFATQAYNFEFSRVNRMLKSHTADGEAMFPLQIAGGSNS